MPLITLTVRKKDSKYYSGILKVLESTNIIEITFRPAFKTQAEEDAKSPTGTYFEYKGYNTKETYVVDETPAQIELLARLQVNIPNPLPITSTALDNINLILQNDTDINGSEYVKSYIATADDPNAGEYIKGNEIEKNVTTIYVNGVATESVRWLNITTGGVLSYEPAINTITAFAGSTTITTSGQAHTLNSYIANTDGAVNAGCFSVCFDFSDDFVGTVNSVAREAGTSFELSSDVGRALPMIEYTIVAGTITIDTLT